jgi:bifunctional non-homologous end joining protein LigD
MPRRVVAGVTITEPDRVVFSATGVSKLELAEWHAELADWILPHFAGRPLALWRCPNGLARCKYVHHDPGANAWAPRSVRREHIRQKKGAGEYLVVDSVASLVELVNGDVIEWHAWNSRLESLEVPDRVIFDLDPGPGVAWARVVELAGRTRHSLAALGLEAWPKLTGGDGLHLVVPFRPSATWDEAYGFARAFAEILAADDPQHLTTHFDNPSRAGKILVDYKRNFRGARCVAAFSHRARTNGTVSVPIGWSELGDDERPEFTTRTVLRRLRRRTRDPWAGYWKTRQALTREIVRAVTRMRA